MRPVSAAPVISPSPLSILRSSRLFGHLTEEELAEVASRLEECHYSPGQSVLLQGNFSRGLVLVAQGRLQAEEGLGEYEAGDYLGEATALGGPEPTTVRAIDEVRALILDREACADLLRTYPDLRPALQLTRHSRHMSRRLALAWIVPGEIIHVLAHPSSATFLSALSLPLLAGGVSLLGLFVLQAYGWTGYIYGLPALGLLYAVPASLWTYWDWVNDLYVVTNRRVVHVERVPLIYEDRQEAPLRMILSVEVESSAIRHRLGFGNVVMRTFTRPIIFRGIARPYQVARVVEELGARDKTRQEQEAQEGIEHLLEDRLGAAPESRGAGAPKSGTELWGSASGAGLSLRYEVGDTIIYRKNYYFLIRNLALPAMLTLLGLALGVLVVLRLLPREATALGLLAVGLFTVGLFWTVYEYVDWAYNIYQVTPDQIIALHRTPLGREDRRSASLENVLSLEYDRSGPLARLLNFGTVVATVGNVRFTFDEVHDPVGVQEDIYRRMESQRARQLEIQRRERGEQIAEWLQAYDEVVRKRRPGGEKKG
ncbi:MAG: cyclic nucleotide-binding domain-containing protein [Anaerolineales bacterium]